MCFHQLSLNIEIIKPMRRTYSLTFKLLTKSIYENHTFSYLIINNVNVNVELILNIHELI